MTRLFKDRPLTRRQVLQALGASGFAAHHFMAEGAIKQLLNYMIDGIVSDAKAQAASGSPILFASFGETGGTNMADFLLPLNPTPDANGNALPIIYPGDEPNGCITRLFDNNWNPITFGGELAGRYDVHRYTTAAGKNWYVPHLWSLDTLPAVYFDANGIEHPTTVRVDSLMPYFICGRGIDYADPQHAIDTLYRSSANHPSVHGCLANITPYPIQTVGTGNKWCNSYYSTTGVNITDVDLSVSDPLTPLLAPFTVPSNLGITPEISSSRQRIDDCLAELRMRAETSHPQAGVLYQNLINARELVSGSFTGLGTTWSALVGKYQRLVDRVKIMNIPGIIHPNHSIVSNGGGRYYWNVGALTNIRIPSGFDLLNMVDDQTNIGTKLAVSFALTEFLFTRNLSGNLILEHGSTYAQRDFLINDSGAREHFSSDTHGMGAITQLIISAYKWLGFAACLNELIRVLKSTPDALNPGKNLFDRTVLAFATEYSRENRVSTSEHLSRSATLAAFSGLTKGEPVITGNCVRDPPNYGQETPNVGGFGSHGVAADNQLNGQDVRLSSQHFNVTMAHLIGAESEISIPNVRSFLRVTPDGVDSELGDPNDPLHF